MNPAKYNKLFLEAASLVNDLDVELHDGYYNLERLEAVAHMLVAYAKELKYITMRSKR